ncbi:hypothetical protein QYE76_021720 [Lolium multiflorum]|uniref:Uncharacterized protein n=1 Tax=Lolium multiflorum TaxID=4521 RepID=A0AAD8VTC4_LOLMU|nr:hypothetical protein QYE76_021720 [Lolium multiflorum]
MPMERSMSCAERSTSMTAPANDLRCHSASYAASFAPAAHKKMQRAKSTLSSSSWSRAVAPAVQRSGSTKTVSSPAPGLNLRCYSASYSTSYNPLSGGSTPQAKGPSTAAAPVWCNAGRRSLNLRSYTPSFAALVDDEAPAKVPAKKAAVAAAPGDDAEAELQRKKRLVAYKVYDVEGKVKGSVRRSVKWIKGKCSRAVYGGM